MSELDGNSIIKAIKTVLPQDQKTVVALHEPCFGGNEWAYVKDCLDSTWVSYLGKYVDRFETMLAEFTGTRKAVAVVNGTAALQIALKLAGVDPGDEVLAPTLTFVATANAIVHCGAVPHFIDSEERTLGLDPHKLKDYLKDIARADPDGCTNKMTGRRIKAVVPMHTFGHPVDLDPLLEVCRDYQIEIVEDAAESLGSFYKGKHTGNWGKLSVLSFNGNKTITTGGGGAIITNDIGLGEMAKHITSTAKIPHQWEYRHDRIGYNYRLPNINAALGCAQMERLPEFLKNKRVLADRYKAAFKAIDGVSFFSEPPDSKSNYWLNVLLIDKALSEQRDAILGKMISAGIMARPAWNLMHTLPIYADCPRMDLSKAEDLQRRIINLPSSPALVGARDA